MTDKFNVSSGQDPQFSRLPEEKDTPFGLEFVYRHGLDYLLKLGYKLVPSPSGVAALHHVYELSEPQKLLGLDIPEGYKIWKQIFDGPSYHLFLHSVEEWINSDSDDTGKIKLWSPLLTPVASKRSTLHALALNRITARAQEQLANRRPLELGFEPCPELPQEDKNYPTAFIPATEWFAPQLREVTADDILTIFPPAERKLFALLLGRAVVGRNNSITASGQLIKHTARMAGIICGPSGIGKSTLFEAIWDAVSWAGYTIKRLKNVNSRFNIGPIATASIIYKDDTSQSELKAIFQSSTAKTIITSNDALAVEDKGQDTYEVIPIGTLFLNANDFNPRDAFSMDSGMASRIKMLSTISKQEAKDLASGQELPYLELGKFALESPDPTPWFHLDWLANRLQVSKISLMLWLLRLCADEFLEAIKNDGPINKLAEIVEETTLDLRIPLYKDVTQQIIISCMFSGRLSSDDQTLYLGSAISSPGEQWFGFGFVEKFHKMSRNLVGLEYLKWHYKNLNYFSNHHPYLGFKNTSSVFTTSAFVEASDITLLGGETDFKKVLHFFKNIRAANGIEVSSDPAWLLKAIEEVKHEYHNLEGMAEEYNHFIKYAKRVKPELLDLSHTIYLDKEKRTEQFSTLLAEWFPIYINKLDKSELQMYGGSLPEAYLEYAANHY